MTVEGFGSADSRYAHGLRAPAVARARPGLSLEWPIAGLTTLSVLALGLVSPELLDFFKIHYISAGGNVLEKLHPATYLLLTAFALLLISRGDPIGEFNRVMSSAKLLLVHFFACALLVFQCIVLKRPFSNTVDTFLVPATLCLIVWNLTPAARKPLAVAVHLFIWVNIALAFYEYFGKHRLIPITLGNQVVTDWRSTALLGHPLAAAGIVAMYTIALLLGPKGWPPRYLRIPAIGIAICSLMVFGGRTALVAVIVVTAGIGIMNGIRLIRGDRFGLASVILTAAGIVLVAVAIPILFGSGVFDRMLDRFSSDNGSAHARIASLHLVTMFDWNELLLGTSPERSGALQSMMGLDYGIENFWIACIVQYGLIQTIAITIGLGCFVTAVMQRSHPAARVVVLFLCVVAASSVSFSSKNITLGAATALMLALLPRERNSQSFVGGRSQSLHRPHPMAALAR